MATTDELSSQPRSVHVRVFTAILINRQETGFKAKAETINYDTSHHRSELDGVQ